MRPTGPPLAAGRGTECLQHAGTHRVCCSRVTVARFPDFTASHRLSKPPLWRDWGAALGPAGAFQAGSSPLLPSPPGPAPATLNDDPTSRQINSLRACASAGNFSGAYEVFYQFCLQRNTCCTAPRGDSVSPYGKTKVPLNTVRIGTQNVQLTQGAIKCGGAHPHLFLMAWKCFRSSLWPAVSHVAKAATTDGSEGRGGGLSGGGSLTPLHERNTPGEQSRGAQAILAWDRLGDVQSSGQRVSKPSLHVWFLWGPGRGRKRR